MDRLTKLEEMNAEAELAGGIDKIEKQHAKGKLTARERITKLLDEDTFMELDKFLQQVEPIVRESKNADELLENASEIGRANS